jgi:hypothetical protein
MDGSTPHAHHDHADAANHHGHHHDGEVRHVHSHGPEVPHPPSALSVSILRLSLERRLAIAALASVALWGAVWLAMR